ncbi:MAG: hypothetical protein KatS3mg009_1815 [Acidimicrobiia bacterium]|nr:MAG: hypothetical protein KatS3mg009_1815 [Acidimicrobiia bacterium]
MAVTAVAAFAVAALTCPLFAALARRAGIVDRPGPLKVQREPVPYLGGLAVLAALAVPVALARPWWSLPMLGAAALGLRDDAGGVPPRVRLAVELAIALGAAAVGPGGAWTSAVTVVAVLVLVNAVNLLDGLDALAPGVTLVGGAGFAAVLTGDAATVAVALVAGLGGFLVWNRPPARIYLGDAGTYLIGVVLALLLAEVLAHGSTAEAAASLLFVAVPVADTAIAILRRLRARRPLFAGDRGHVYDQLVDRGWDPRRAVAACVAAQAVFVAAGLALAALPAGAAVAAVAAVVAVVATFAIPVFTAPARWQG